MTDKPIQIVEQETEDAIRTAFAIAAENCGGKPRMLAALNITESWMYTSMKRARVPLSIALKLQVLTRGAHRAQDLCPTEFQKINAVAEYLTE